MADMMLIRDAAKLWDMSERKVAKLCREGKIKDARKDGRYWMVPVYTEKPAVSQKPDTHKRKHRSLGLPLPVGVSDYRLASSEYYYVDKTMMIKDFIDERPLVSLFTRPRRFGKTLNMDMLRTFFEKTEGDTSVYFKDKKIWSCGKKYQKHQGKYPVIYVTFKDIKFNTWEKAFYAIQQVFADMVNHHKELLTSDKCTEGDRQYLQRIVSGTGNEVDLSRVFLQLSRMLHSYHGVAPIIIIDEYDIPIQQGYMMGYYDEIVIFMRNLFSGGFKDNKHLSYGFMTGILRVAKESIFSGLNNLIVHSVLDEKYSSYFGFTSEEVREMAEYYGVLDRYDEICEWYDGYRFGETDIFNPWSVINYFSNRCEPKAFWQSTGNSDIIGEIIAGADEEVHRNLISLINGESFVTCIDTSVIYPQIKKDPSTIYSFLLVAGYLKVLNKNLSFSGDSICEVALPNKEISLVYYKEILWKLRDLFPSTTAVMVQDALLSGDNVKLRTVIEKMLLQSVSSFDTAGENFYHGFLLGLCALMGGFFITSNRESGKGRYDIQLKPKKKSFPGILIELKAEKHCDPEKLQELSETALQQIKEKQYDTEMIQDGIVTIYRYGVAFSGKQVCVSVG